MGKRIQQKAVSLASEILAQPEFADLKPLGQKVKLIKCNAGSFIPSNWVCYGEHLDIRCSGCKYKGKEG